MDSKDFDRLIEALDNIKEAVKENTKSQEAIDEKYVVKCIRDYKKDRLKFIEENFEEIFLQPELHDFDYKGYTCLVGKKLPNLFNLGYFRIPIDEYNLVKENNKIENFFDLDLDVHGGVTFDEEYCNFCVLSHGMTRGEFRYVGFDCGHGDDLSFFNPSMPGATYKTQEFAINETKKMIDSFIEKLEEAKKNAN